MKKLLLVISSISFLLLGGCASFTADKSFDPSSSKDESLVIVSFDQTYKVIKWMYRDLTEDKGVKGFNESFISTAEITGVIQDGRTQIYPFTLKPGKYEFFRWTTPEVGHYTASKDDFSIKFEVLPNKATYIGQIKLHTSSDKKYLIKVVDNEEQDVGVIMKKYKNISEGEIAKKIMIKE